MKIPFNLHDAIDGKSVINGAGEDFEFEVYYPGTNYPVVGNFGNVKSRYTKNGQRHTSEISDRFDLFMKPEKITRWIFARKDHGFDSKESALKCVDISYMNIDTAIIKIEFYEGEGRE